MAFSYTKRPYGDNIMLATLDSDNALLLHDLDFASHYSQA